MKFISPLVVLCFCAALPISAQESPHSMPDPRPAVLLSGMGNHHHPISTTNPEAQKFFDQGLILVFGFNREEAFRSFRRAAELDPQSPMPYWGMALALGFHLNMDLDMDVRASAAYEAIHKAVALSPRAPQYERDYVAALARRCSSDPHADRSKLEIEYKNAMADLAARYPDDTDAATLYAESLVDLYHYQWYDASGRPAPGVEDLLALLESILRREPDHPGANHFYVHVLDTSPHPERALASAHRLTSISPGVGHLVHMAGHIFWNVGDYRMAALVNERAASADRDYMRLTGVTDNVYPEAYYSHNLHFIFRSYAELGHFQEARSAAELLAAHVPRASAHMPGMADGYLSSCFLLLLRFQHWDDVLHYPKPDPRMPLSTALWHYARAIAFSAQGNRQSATLGQQALLKGVETAPKTTEFFSNPPDKIIQISVTVLEARLATDADKAISLWQKAVALQDALAYDEPPPWYYPVRESLGAALLRNGQTAEAEAVFREDLNRNPRNPRALYGLWHSLQSQGRSADAEWARMQFEETWKNADLTLRLEDF